MRIFELVIPVRTFAPRAAARYGFLLAAMLLLVACSSEPTAEQAQLSWTTGWPYSDSLRLPLTVTRPGAAYRMVLQLHADDRYPFRNLYLRFSLREPSGRRTLTLTDMVLADVSGQWHVKPELDGSYRLSQVLMPRLSFPTAGRYELGVQQFMRLDTLPGIRSLSLRLEPVAEDSATARPGAPALP